MAQAITFHTARNGNHAAAAEYEEALQSARELLQLLHESGILNLLRGLIGGGNHVIEALSEATDTAEAIRAIRNFLLLTKFFASIPPDVLSSLVQTAIEGARKEKSRKAPGFIGLSRKLSNQDSRHALSVMLDLIESVGKGL